ncbi:putative translation initiation factor eIF-2B subunit epsilon [Morella rubra]|uniref:Translation initiation factor eIF2B subunit epsilon n=1 Tax=Morella rubra TaxID=262757 RepID=A0A6A1VP21_9ROSI|nr:putative translation initiation factor eIF-2B subunit epsilon [Morella rubra]
MGAHRKGATRISEDSEELARVPLQAILLADSFATKFRPITLERPKVLLPLVNVPMLNYTLAWLESAGVEEVIVFCCAHSKQVIDFLESSEWFSQPNFSVTMIESHHSVSAGDALRLIYERNVIHGDFILISGDTVSNMPLTQVLQEHRERRKKDANAVMTMVIKRSKPSPITRQSRLGTDELFMAIDPNTKQLLYYEDKADYSKGVISLDKLLLVDNASISLHNDIQDCYIDICSPEVLSLFTDNFDYQHLRRHFVKGLLLDDVCVAPTRPLLLAKHSYLMCGHYDGSSANWTCSLLVLAFLIANSWGIHLFCQIMGYKIFTHEIHSSYAARIENFRSYDAISKDIIQRWTYPFVPDVKFCGNSATKLERQGMYRATEVVQSRSAEIGPFTVIGNGTTIGSNTKISNSVVGEMCTIGSNVSIEGSYIWNNVAIEDGCKLMHAIICDGVTVKSGAVLEPGVVLSFKVVIGQQFVVPSYSKVSLLQQPTKQDSDEELEYADNSSGIVEISSITDAEDQSNGAMTSQSLEEKFQPTDELGTGGVGYVWSICEGSHEEEWRHSIAPIPADKLAEAMESTEEDLDLITQNGSVLPPSGELKPDSNDSDDDNEDSRDDSVDFEKEVELTFLRAVHENIKEDHLILEVNSLRLSFNKIFADCAGAIFYSLMKLALETPHNSPSELCNNALSVITKWKKLLKSYLTDIDEQIEVILKFEEMCLESAKEFSPLFAKVPGDDIVVPSGTVYKHSCLLLALASSMMTLWQFSFFHGIRLQGNCWQTTMKCRRNHTMLFKTAATDALLDSSSGEANCFAANLCLFLGVLFFTYFLKVAMVATIFGLFLGNLLALLWLGQLRILWHLYDKDLIQEDAVLKWDDEKKDADDYDKVFVKQSEKFIQWLREASEEEDEDEDAKNDSGRS